jgi:hypothetical protein
MKTITFTAPDGMVIDKNLLKEGKVVYIPESVLKKKINCLKHMKN